MKAAFVAASLLLAATLLSLSSPARCDNPPSLDDVVNSINAWIQDVDEVNNFLNVAASLSDPTGAAAQTKETSLNEPVQLGVLSSVSGLSEAGQSAVLLLEEIFSNVPTDLQSIVDDPSPTNVQIQLNSINNVRCLNVLPSLDILWAEAAAAVGADVPPTADRPFACSNINQTS